MKKLFVLLAGLFLFLCFTGVANAIPTTWTDTYSAGILMYSDYYHHSYEHNITGSNGFEPGTDLVYTWDIKLSFTDDKDLFQWEWALVDLPGLIADRFFEVSFNETIYTGFSVAGTLSLNANGILGIDIYRAAGDFYFTGSTLNAYGDSDFFGSSLGNVSPVPEPASLLLLGTGLIGIAGVSRKKFFKKDSVY